MAWEQRPSGRRFYYRKVWRGGTCKSEYVGGGPIAPLYARLDDIERAKRETERADLRREQDEQDAMDRQIDELGGSVGELVTAALIVGGYHTHKRQWRRQRGDYR